MTDLDSRRAEVFADVAAQMGWHGVPAPTCIRAYDNNILALDFDTAEHVEAWAKLLGTGLDEQTYVPDWPGWKGGQIRSVRGHLEWKGWRMQISGWSDAVAVTA